MTAKTLDDVAVDLVYHAPFYAHVLAGIPRERGETTTLVAQGPKVVLRAREPEIVKLPPPQARGVLLHETLHLLLHHPLRRGEFRDPRRFDVAADLVVHGLIPPAEREPNALHAGLFPGFPAEATVEDYYALLAAPEAAEQLERLLAGEERDAQDEGGEGAGGGDDDGDRPGRCHARRGHARWESFADEGGDRLLREAYLAAVTAEAFSRALQAGHGSSALLRALGRTLRRAASADWRTVFRRFGSSAAHTRLEGTIARPSKRFGTVPGVRVRREASLVVAIDTSGSLTAEDLALIDAELRHVARAGAAVHLIYCDDAVVGEGPFRGALPPLVPGGGGTSFEPALRAADARAPDGIVYFTDGWVSAVTFRPRAPVLVPSVVFNALCVVRKHWSVAREIV